ncbi:Cytochrome P450, partial [Macrophomina phaseolina MS6]
MFREVHRHGNGFRKSNWYKLFAGYYDANEGNYSLFLLTDPKLHAIRRKLMARAFSKSEIRKNWEEEIKRKVEFAVTRMQQDASADPNGEVDIQKWWVLMAADVSSMITFGESFNSLQAGEKDIFLEAIERIGKINGICAEFPILNALKNVPLPFVRKFFSIQSSAMEFANRTVENSRKHGTTGAGNIFTGILAEAEKSESYLSDIVLTREARSLIIAGTDTTAISLTFLVWCVLSRPQLHQNILDELREAKQARSTSGDDGMGEELSDEQLEQLPILNAAISETLRLYGAAPGALPRIPVQGGVTIGGLYVPDSVTVSTQAWSLHRHPGLWENPE